MRSHRRLFVLTALLIAALLLRWWDPAPLRGDTAIVRPSEPHVQVHAVVNAASAPVASPATTWPVRLQVDEAPAADPFAPREAAPPASVVQAVAAPTPSPAPQPPPEPVQVQIPSPPFQIIGTWGTGTGTAVFLAGPEGTVMAREGDIVLRTYRVTEISSSGIALQASDGKQRWALPIPAPANDMAVGGR